MRSVCRQLVRRQDHGFWNRDPDLGHQAVVEEFFISAPPERVVYDQVKLIDFTNPDNNDWLVVNQFTVIENKKDRRPDVVVCINGLPLGVI